MSKPISRRDFLKKLAVGAAGVSAIPRILAGDDTKPDRLLPASDVIWCSDVAATTGSTIIQSIVQIMMDTSMRRLTGISNLGDA